MLYDATGTDLQKRKSIPDRANLSKYARAIQQMYPMLQPATSLADAMNYRQFP